MPDQPASRKGRSRPPAAPFGYPLTDLRAPTHPDRLLLWLARRQWRTLLGGVAAGVPWMLSIALVPAVIGWTIDHGMVAHDARSLLLGSLAVLGLGAVSAVATNVRHWFAVHNWLLASLRSAQVAEASVRRSGVALTRRMDAGEAVTTFTNDIMRMGAVFDVTARFSGALVSFAVVALILLRGSRTLGLVMLIGGPVLVASLALVVRPLQRRQQERRGELGKLTALGTDTVAGLRILRGIGGERVFLDRYAAQSGAVRRAGERLAPVQATLDAAQVLLPGLFVLLVTSLGAHLAAGGQLRPGQLVAYFGYTTFLTMPLRTAVEFAEKYITTRVAAERITRLLRITPEHAWAGGDRPAPAGSAFPPEGDLLDPASGIRVRRGLLTGLVSARPEDSMAVAARLGGHGERADEVTVADRPLRSLPLSTVRAHVVVSEAGARLFSGTVRSELAVRPGASDEHLRAAIATASADDVLDALAEGLEAPVEEAGRAFSGGQRQRLVLARALAADPQVLVLLEPTSAVDAHTEARIAGRLPHHRRGKTTLVTTASPILLDACDEVVFLVEGQENDRGEHHALLRRNAAYREVVLRGEDL